jgi:hypothetical protein
VVAAVHQDTPPGCSNLFVVSRTFPAAPKTVTNSASNLLM